MFPYCKAVNSIANTKGCYNMDNKFHMSGWVYIHADQLTVDEVDEWAKAGFTTIMSPEVGLHEVEKLIPYLDRAEKCGIQLLANVMGVGYHVYPGLGEEGYTKRFTEVYEKLKGHPALYGFHCGDEPRKEALEDAIEAIRIQKLVAPELTPIINLRGSTCEMFSEKPGDTFVDWLKHFKERTGVDTYCWDSYSQMINDGGVTFHIDALKKHNYACKEAGMKNWVTLLSSAHWWFKYPTEYQFMWQITTAAAAGSTGVCWFRLYDKECAPDYHGSPVDEFGNKTEQFHRLKRCQRRFNDQFGLLWQKMHLKATYLTGFPRMSYSMFNEYCHDVIKKLNIFEECMISFFEDDEGKEYFAIVNIEMEQPVSVNMEFDSSKAKLTRLDCNGTIQRSIDADDDLLDLYPGQMLLYRIDRK